jgi:hypothetical protein
VGKICDLRADPAFVCAKGFEGQGAERYSCSTGAERAFFEYTFFKYTSQVPFEYAKRVSGDCEGQVSCDHHSDYGAAAIGPEE